uniref:ABC transporter ATP-binding protein n=1 Tax=Candidatus Ventrenecus sp. TaxID=3085654 RepID=UPI004025514A
MHRGPQNETAKDFGGSMKRLFKELKTYQKAIFLALVLATLGSILSLFAPNKLSDLTDEIQKGLIINQDNMTEIATDIQNNLMTSLPEYLNFNLDNNTLMKIMISSSISTEEKENFQTYLSDLKDGKKDFTYLATFSDDLLNLLFADSNFKGITVTKEDKISFLKGMNNKEFVLKDEVKNVLLPDITIDNITISSKDQVSFLNILSTLDESNSSEIYQKLDEAPESVLLLIEPYMDMDAIKKIALFLLTIYLISALFNYVEAILMTNVSNGFAKELRGKISHKINLLPLKYFDAHQSGDILSRVTNDVDSIAQSLNMSLSPLVSALTLFFGTIIMMFVTNWILALTAILSSLLGFVFMFGVLSKSQKYFVARQEELGALNGHIEEVYGGLNVVKAYNGQKISNEKFDALNEKVYNANRKSQFLSGLMMPMMSFIGNFGYVAVCIVGALLTINGKISFGVIIAFITYVRMFTSPLSQIAQAMTSLQSTAAASERVFEFLDEEEMKDESSLKEHLSLEEAKGNIEFKNVVFKYDGNEKPTIHNFSAKVKSGQKVAIVGPTGAGKTTMVNLLMKFYDISGGDIIIDGKSIKDLTRENIHDLFTMVLQDTWLFNGSIKENIIYSRDNINDDDVKRVCKVVGLDHFIKTLSDGYDTELGDNDSVSSGQRQLLTIARAMLSSSPFLILDEATSNVDTRTEELVQKAMDKLCEGKTSFIIAHRLSTIKNADLILVMKDGNIIETGNHEELMKQHGFYADLYNSQFEK